MPQGLPLASQASSRTSMGSTVMVSTACRFGCRQAQEVHLCSANNPQKRRCNFAVLHVHSAESLPKQGDCVNQGNYSKQGENAISRREWLAFGVYIAENLCARSFIGERADAAEEDKSAVKVSTSGDEEKRTDAGGDLDSPLNGLLSLFDTNEKTKTGKLLPKSYVKSARNVVKSLKESLKEESSKERDVRKSADQAKEAIREYLQNWRGQKAVESEDSYKALEGAIQILGRFYSKQGPRAVLPSNVKSQILTNLEVADAAL